MERYCSTGQSPQRVVAPTEEEEEEEHASKNAVQGISGMQVRVKVKVKVSSLQNRSRRSRGGVKVQLYTFFNLGARWGEWSTPRPGRFNSGKDKVPIVWGAGWVPGLVWTGAENLVPTGIRSPDRPTRSQSLYRLSYPGSRQWHVDRDELFTSQGNGRH